MHRVAVPTLILVASVSLAFVQRPTPSSTENVRDQQTIRVDGVEEVWRLVWTTPAKPFCRADVDDLWTTCPCDGFAFGESGDLTLVRLRDGREHDRLNLTRFFPRLDGPRQAFLQ